MPDSDGRVIAMDAPAPGRPGRGLTRREGLLALAILAPAGLLAACSGSAEPPSGSASASAPPVDLAGEIAAEESALIASYDAVLAGAAGLDAATTNLLTMIRDQHAQHRDALGGAAEGPPPSGAPSPTVAALIAAERDAARSRIRACVAADDAELARLLAFIGASEASHVPALRDLAAAGA